MAKARYIETVSKQNVSLGEFHLERHMLGNGKILTFDVFHLPSFAIIIPYNKNLKKFLLIKQYRPSWRRISLEFPAGVVDPGENLIETAYRELEEETGFKALTMNEIGTFPTSARTTQTFSIFYTDSMIETKKNLDEGEFIEDQLWLTAEEIETAIDQKEMIGVSHIASWYRFQAKQKKSSKNFLL